ncbi:helix-turn-helix transcriptional regulator [Dyadobacter sp. CY107]|uniref:response regulator transcription factor n=1 Tax=Dyadobacter fanqingshengii TaxID=2906443 RepID=UPI001F2D7E74|nr:response regulator transcription factor [Dyadobacter fanqingshengii]MCF2505321.1 helix-turn-helix transcriptional regulator [Dyadobacter fanqingshengii]
MDYRVFTPHKLLAPYVRYFSALNFNKLSGLSQIKVFADRYPHLVFQHNNGRSAFFRDTDALPPAFISGVKISPYILDLDNHEVVTVTFYPQAIKQLFGINVNELNDQIVDLINFAPADLLERLYYSRCLAERIDLLTEFLLKKINDAAPPDHLISESIRLINDIDIETSLNSLSNHFKISTRQFERRFKSSTGLSPKLFIRAARFESALQAIKDNHFENLSSIAYHLNFADQSHFIKEFKAFSGLTPKTFLFNNQKTQSVLPDNGVVTINHLVTEC